MNWFGVCMGVCAAASFVCTMSANLVWFKMVSQIKKLDRAFPVSARGRASFDQMTLVFKTHRSHYPESKLRTAFWALVIGMFTPIVVLAAVFVTYPGPPSR